MVAPRVGYRSPERAATCMLLPTLHMAHPRLSRFTQGGQTVASREVPDDANGLHSGGSALPPPAMEHT